MSAELNELKQSVLAALPTTKEGALSATSVSKMLGYSKANKRVQAALVELEKEETILSETHDRGYTIYYKDDKKTKSVTKEAASKAVPEFSKEVPKNDEKVPGIPRIISKYRIPTATYGYEVESNVDVTVPGEEGDEVVKGIRITTPEGNKVFELAPWQRLLVVNQNEDYRFIVERPEDIFEAINIYTEEKGIGNFLVTDMESNAAVTEESLENMDVALLFLSISRHNKAGLL